MELDRARHPPARPVGAGHLQVVQVVDAFDLQCGGHELRSEDGAPERPAVAVGSVGWQRGEVLAQHMLHPPAHGRTAVPRLDDDAHRNRHLTVGGGDDVELRGDQPPGVEPGADRPEQRGVGRRCVGVKRVLRGPHHDRHHAGSLQVTGSGIEVGKALGPAHPHDAGQLPEVACCHRTVVPGKLTRYPAQRIGDRLGVGPALEGQGILDRHRLAAVDLADGLGRHVAG